MKNYQHLDDLPQALTDELPEMAQRLYLAVYRRTWEKCSMGGDVREDELAAKAHDAAMLAVQRQFEKDESGRWRQTPIGDDVDTDKLDGQASDGD